MNGDLQIEQDTSSQAYEKIQGSDNLVTQSVQQEYHKMKRNPSILKRNNFERDLVGAKVVNFQHIAHENNLMMESMRNSQELNSTMNSSMNDHQKIVEIFKKIQQVSADREHQLQVRINQLLKDAVQKDEQTHLYQQDLMSMKNDLLLTMSNQDEFCPTYVDKEELKKLKQELQEMQGICIQNQEEIQRYKSQETVQKQKIIHLEKQIQQLSVDQKMKFNDISKSSQFLQNQHMGLAILQVSPNKLNQPNEFRQPKSCSPLNQPVHRHHQFTVTPQQTISDDNLRSPVRSKLIMNSSQAHFIPLVEQTQELIRKSSKFYLQDEQIRHSGKILLTPPTVDHKTYPILEIKNQRINMASKIPNIDVQNVSPKFAQITNSARLSLSPLKLTRGRLKFQNGDWYEGDIQNKQRHGYGILKDKEGDEIYVGYWVNDLYHGSGMLKNKSYKTNYQVDYKDINIVNSNWLHYSGQFTNSKFTGIGNILFTNQDRYQGSFKDGIPSGTGTYIRSNGENIRGHWHLGLII